jgi:hypothetical protein
MIPRRVVRVRKIAPVVEVVGVVQAVEAVEEENEIEISDEDVIEVVSRPVPPKQTRSGTYAVTRPRETARPLPPAHDELPRMDSVSDGVETSVSDLIGDLARLSDVTRTPMLRGIVEWNDLSPSDAWIVSIVSPGMTIETIMQMSPLGEEETLRALARLISSRTLTLPHT